MAGTNLMGHVNGLEGEHEIRVDDLFGHFACRANGAEGALPPGDAAQDSILDGVQDDHIADPQLSQRKLPIQWVPGIFLCHRAARDPPRNQETAVESVQGPRWRARAPIPKGRERYSAAQRMSHQDNLWLELSKGGECLRKEAID